MVATLAACNDIKTDERFIEVDAVAPQRTVLLVDFTGQNCLNCPRAHGYIDDIVKQYGDAFIPVSVHGGDFGIAVENTSFEDNYIGLATAKGDAMNKEFDVAAWPSGVIDYKGPVLSDADWSGAVRDAMKRPSEADIQLTATLSDEPSAQVIDVKCTVEPKSDFNGQLRIWVLEDGIVARQRNGSKIVPDYVHDHVFRCSVEGREGANIKFSRGIHQTFDDRIAVRHNDHERWNADKLSIVAFVLGDAGVIQAAKVHVTTNE